jgi:predicted ATP-dependent endonuclease of OLD family
VYKIESVEIDGFWQQFTAQCTFNPDVNIIIGKNGTGKTTFMNILHSVLTVDPTELAENEFQSVNITLSKGIDKCSIIVVKEESEPYPTVTYNTPQKPENKFRLRGTDGRRIPLYLRRKLYEEFDDIREELASLVSIASNISLSTPK